MKCKIKKSLSLLLVLCMLFSVFSVNLTVYSEDTATPQATPTVEIVSFMRGSQTDLRSSELLEAKVSGYDGNVRELVYKWESSLGTYLYVYNSHNMYNIQGTSGEIEIYNNKIPASTSMGNRAYKDSFTAQGFCWASIYGSNTSGIGANISDANAYNGTIKVTVYDKVGNMIGSDTHKGTVTLLDGEYSYSGIIDHNLKKDIDNLTIGLFEGDRRNVKDLLGESAIVHITCVQSSVTNGTIISGKSNISLEKKGDYFITGKIAGTSTNYEGDAQVQLTVKKNSCKFHEYTTATATTTVYVFKKPKTETTAYTLTLVDNLDNRCRYFIDGREGVKQDDGTILFDGLTPNTKYTVEVRGEYKDKNNATKYAYAYVYDTTKPIYNGTVNVYLDGTYNSATHTAQGTKVNLDEVSKYSTIYVKKVNGTEFIELKKVENAVGVYTNTLDSGSYELYYEPNVSTKIDEQLLVINNADRIRYLFYNSVTYKDGSTELKKEYHETNSLVNVWNEKPIKEGWYFIGWKDESNGKIYKSSDELTANISRPYVLTAQWEEGVDVYVNISLDHQSNDGGVNYGDSLHKISYDLMTKYASSSNYEDLLNKELVWDGKSSFDVSGYTAKYENNKTTYTATLPVAEDVKKTNDYTVEIAKSGYELKSVTKTIAANGDIIINAELKYTPSNCDFKFFVKLDEESKSLPDNLLPDAVHVKVTSWYDTPFDDVDKVDWYSITQHKDAFITVTLNENGVGEGFYPVWTKTADGEKYQYRIEVISYLLPDGTVLPAKDATEISDHHITEKHTDYCTDDLRYHAKINVSEEGESPDDTATTLKGAYFDNNVQIGEVKAVVSVMTHTVTFQPNLGEFSDGVTENKIITKQILVPNLNDYKVTRAGGYVFDGWYVVENGEMTNKTVSSGDEIFSDLTLRAKWREPLTVEGVVSIAGYYYLNNDENEPRIIHSVDRAHTITVYLQKILPQGYSETIATQKINIVYNDQSMIDVEKPIGTGNYRFTAIPDDGLQYRVYIQNPNYDVKYQNEPDSIDMNKAFDYRNSYFYENQADSFMAKFTDGDPLTANVNVFMKFAPLYFKLNYAVYTSKIGEGFRPTTTDVLVLYDDLQSGDYPQYWPVISNMIVDDQVFGQKTDIDSQTSIGKASYDVWITSLDGQSLYDYAVKLQNYTINDIKSEFIADDAPFRVSYNGSARYSALQNLDPEHQTQLLTIELEPKRYKVTFDINFTQTSEDYVTNMDDYAKIIDDELTYNTAHTWSYNTDISNVIPSRKGYTFLGWYDKNGNKVTKIDASVHEDTILKAKWDKPIKVTFHANNLDIDYDVFRTYYENGEALNGKNDFSLNADGSLDSFYDIPEFDYTTHNNYVFKGWYLDKENDLRPINWSEKYTEDTDVYAHWILVDEVEKDAADTKISDKSGKYLGYDLLGVQIRDIIEDNLPHYGTEETGLRFVTVLSENVYSQINALSLNNKSGAEYGYVLAKTSTAIKYAGNTEDYQLQYKGANVNGKNTSTEYKYVQNVKCSGVPDHFYKQNKYRLYTAVVTFNNLQGEALAQAHSQELVARSYIRYTDANGLLRTHYNNYTGTNTYHGCSASFDLAKSLMNG